MGRHLWRMMRPAFLGKMLRTRAASLYGWDILLRGTLWPGPVIGKQCPDSIREAARAGHEVGLHAWDHHYWQTRVEKMGQDTLICELQRGYNLLRDLLGQCPDCFAAPSWRVTPDALEVLGQFPFRFESDCRGRSLFRLIVGGRRFRHIQVPTTLPTYDEVVGLKCKVETYNDYLLKLIRPDGLNVLTIHAETEGIGCLSLFRDLLREATKRNIDFKALGDILSHTEKIEESGIYKSAVSGRVGWLACQGRL